MRRALLTLVAILPLVAACAGPTDPYATDASRTSRDAFTCQRDGGVWHPNLGVCEAGDRWMRR